nr:mucin-7-like isoform X1 [Cherax quadricarinatus]
MKKTQDAAKKKPTSNTPTYAAIAKIQANTTKLLQASTQPASTIITPPTCDVTKIYYCLLYAHMQNMAVPGSFNSTINELFALNNMPSFTFPASPPSEEILKFTKNLIAKSSAEVPSTPPTSDVTPAMTNEKPPPPPPLTESNQSEALPPETSSNSSTEVENEATPPSSTPPPPSLLSSRRLPETPCFKHKGLVFYTTRLYPASMTRLELIQHLQDNTVTYQSEERPLPTYNQILHHLQTNESYYSSPISVIQLSRKQFTALINGLRP